GLGNEYRLQRSAGFRAPIKFQRWKNLIFSPSSDNPIPADTSARAKARTTARSGGTREASLTMPIHSSNSRGLSHVVTDSMVKPAPLTRAFSSEPGNLRTWEESRRLSM